MLMPFEERTSEKNTIKIQLKIKLELRLGCRDKLMH